MRISILTILLLLLTISIPNLVNAQKAYELVRYRSIIYGDKVALTLADGYFLASKIIIYSKYGNQIFVTLDNEPDRRGNLQFQLERASGRYKNVKGSLWILTGLADGHIPDKIRAIYWDGKARKTILFARQ